MSEYPYQDKIHSNDRISNKEVFSSDGVKIGRFEAVFSDTIIIKSESQDNIERKYEIPRLNIAELMDETLTLKIKKSEIDKEFETSSIEKSYTNNNP